MIVRLSKIRETGLMRRTFKKWWGTSSSCGARTGSEAFTAISLHETGSAFLILILGACMAIAFTILEFVLSMKRDNWRDNTVSHRFMANEFAAPVVQGTVANLLPLILQNDRPFIWSMQESTNQNGADDLFMRKKFVHYEAPPVFHHTFAE